MLRFVAMMAIVASFLPSAFGQEAKDKDKPKESPEQKAVRAYLKENLPTGKWEEIKWWSVLPGTAISKSQKGTVIRLKYRAENQFGGQSVYDHVYVLVDGKLYPHTNDPVHANRDRIFETEK